MNTKKITLFYNWGYYDQQAIKLGPSDYWRVLSIHEDIDKTLARSTTDGMFIMYKVNS